jgi:multicomponent Na+:H+ antiporter subunit D
MSSYFHPAFILIIGGLILPLLGSTWRSILALLLPLIALVVIWTVPDGSHYSISFLSYELEPYHVDKLSRLFITVFTITAFTGVLYCYKQASSNELSAALVYAGSALGVTLAGDLVTLFIFWEFMALASTLVVWSARTNASWYAGMRYVFIHLLGGVILMAGIAAYSQETGSIAFTTMHLDSLSTWLILTGFLINTGAPPLSAWIADAYPESSFSGMVFLSAFTTKTAIYVLLRGYPGTELLIYIGLFMIFYGIIYALLENDMRRILAYSIVNQVGFMVCGIGIGTELALNGAAAHAFTHIIYKALLLMSAGAVLYMTGKRKCTDLGGLFQTMPVTCICGIIGALSISAFPVTSGFVSKSMMTQATADGQMLVVWLLLQAASAGVFLHAGIKFPWFVFFQQDSGLRPPEAPLNMRLAMIFFSVLSILIGIIPGGLLYQLLPYNVDYFPYTVDHVLLQLQLLLFSGLAFFVMLPFMQRTLTISLDIDWIYRKALPEVLEMFIRLLSVAGAYLGAKGGKITGLLTEYVVRLYGPHGALSREIQTGVVVLLVVLMLGIYLLVYLVTI